VPGYGSIEAGITNSSSWTVSVDDGGGADVATVTASTRYPTEFRAAFVAALNTATGKTFTLSGSYGSGGSVSPSMRIIHAGSQSIPHCSKRTLVAHILDGCGFLLSRYQIDLPSGGGWSSTQQRRR